MSRKSDVYVTALQEKKSNQIAQALCEKIIRGELQPGEKLRQIAVSRDYGVSHATVREAMLQLAAQGLTIVLPRRGMCVAPLDRNAADELKVMRQALEPVALAHSIPNLTKTQIAKADKIRLTCDAAKTALDWEEANREFHMAIIAGCAMPRLTEEISNLQLLYARHFLAKHASNWKRRSDPDHLAIILAIKDRDIHRATAVLHRHLARLS